MISSSVLEKLEFTKVLNQISNYSITERGKVFINSTNSSIKVLEGILLEDIYVEIVALYDSGEYISQ